VFAEHLENVFKPNDVPSPITPCPRLEPGERIKFFSPGEIMSAIKKMNPIKAPGLDLITAGMLKKCRERPSVS